MGVRIKCEQKKQQKTVKKQQIKKKQFAEEAMKVFPEYNIEYEKDMDDQEIIGKEEINDKKNKDNNIRRTKTFQANAKKLGRKLRKHESKVRLQQHTWTHHNTHVGTHW